MSDNTVHQEAGTRLFLAGAARFHRTSTATEEPWRDRIRLRLNQLCAALLLLLLGPLMLFVAYRTWRDDGAPLFFGHYRVGRNGKLFRCMKFRTMYGQSDRMLRELLAQDPAARAEWDRDQKLCRDPRITPVGHFLRRTSLDELPQLFNVLNGTMSLIGPRPITVAELPRYGVARWHYLGVRPGMTGLWQVSGRNDTTYEERVELDHLYVESRSIALRLRILFRTVGVVLAGSGAR